ncbi:M56 family metallopeptidase [Kribbella ginsengisoli]|uniref:M56 family metallopeptidase n=1 Tax=Kribbella ginsengisoli TaxID=363865 RepID=A0ABP6YPC8_9ACTN
MRFFVYLPLLLSLVVPLVTTRMARWLPPDLAARTATAGAAISAVAYAASLTMLSLTLFDDLPPLSAFDHRSELPRPVPGWLAAFAALALLAGGIRVVADLVRRTWLRRDLRAMGVSRAGIAVADVSEPFAVAVPGRPGHVLVTSGMLRLLDDRERGVMLAHERSHLLRHHHRLVAITGSAAAMNPLLARVPALVAFLVERWADEDAAARTGDRQLVARTVAKASLAARGRNALPVMGLHGSRAVDRVAAMTEPKGPKRWGSLAGIVALAMAQVLATGLAVAEFVAVAGSWLGLVS